MAWGASASVRAIGSPTLPPSRPLRGYSRLASDPFSPFSHLLGPSIHPPSFRDRPPSRGWVVVVNRQGGFRAAGLMVPLGYRCAYK